MPKKKRKQRKARNGRRPAEPRRGGDRSRLLAGFTAWLAKRDVTDDPETYFDVVETALDLKESHLGLAVPAEWDAELVDVVVGELMPAKVLADEDYARIVAPAMRAYLTFLAETGRWQTGDVARRQALARLDVLEPELPARFTGFENKSFGARVAMLAQDEGVDLDDQEQLSAFVERFNAMPYEWRKQATGDLDALDEPELDEETDRTFVFEVTDEDAELAGLRELPVFGQATRLLDWIGRSRKVTTTGALRLADIPEVAEALGIEAPPRLESMWQCLDLASVWAAAREAGLIELTATTVRPGPAAAAWPRAEAADVLRTARVLVGGLIVAIAVNGGHHGLSDPVEPHVDALVLLTLAAAAAGDTRFLESTVDELRSGLSPAGPAGFFVADLAKLRLELLSQQHLVTCADQEVTVPEICRPALAGPLRASGFDIELVDRDGKPVNRELPGFDTTTPDAAAKQVYQLKVRLDGSRPPIWRRLRVRGDTRLADLHHILQTAFGWHDTHPHQFVAVNAYGTAVRYVPEPDEDDGWGPEPVDESTVTIAEILPGTGSRLDYEYDFGDTWSHVITVESVQPVDAHERLPRCTGGRRMAPYEDSGGVWGWMDKVEAAAEPDHPEHAEIRAWLGLADGERLDPAAFDPAAVDAHLRALTLHG